MSVEASQLKKPVFKAPRTPPKWGNMPLDEGLEAMKTHLQTAVILELYTIPLYLYAAYSIKDNPLSTYKIINVVKQEMLHLGLAGNILCSIGGTPHVYGNEYTPKYPREIFYEPVEMNLLPGNKDTIHTFMKIEEPFQPPPVMRMAQPLLPEYHSIGEFYQEVLWGLQILHGRFEREGRKLFLEETFPKQFQTADGSWYDPDMAVITDIKVAKAALDVIILQGEGSTGQEITSGIQSHYEVFKELYEKHPLDCYDVVENIVTEEYEGENFHGLMKAADASYSYLLMTIEGLWKYDGPLRGRLVTNNIMNLMLTILKPLALFLVEQKITKGPNAGKHAAAPYRRHDFGSDPFTELKTITKEALEQYPGEESLEKVGECVEKLIDLKQLGCM